MLERGEIQSLIKAGELTIEEILSLGWEACLCLSDEKVIECIKTSGYSLGLIVRLEEYQAKRLMQSGYQAVLIKAGHLTIENILNFR